MKWTTFDATAKDMAWLKDCERRKPMRPLEDAQADWDAIKEVQVNMISAYPEVRRLWHDIPDLLATLAERDAEIERLKAAAERFSRKIAGLPE